MVKINFLYPGGAQEKSNNQFTFSHLRLIGLASLIVLVMPAILHSAPGPNIVPPTILIPEANEIVTSRQPYIKGVTLNETLVDIYVDGVYNGRATTKDHPSGTASWAYKIFLPLEYDAHEIFAVARSQDEVFRSTESIHTTFELERPLPAPHDLTLEANPDNWQQPTLSGFADTSDELEVFIDGVLQMTLRPSSGADNNFVFNYNPATSLEPGWHSFKVRARDSRGKYSHFSQTLVAEIRDNEFTPLTAPALRSLAAQGQNNVPTPTLLAPETNSVHSSSKPSIVGLAHNGQQLEIFIDNILNGEVRVGAHESGVASFKYRPFLELQPGTHLASARAIATDGQKSGWSNTVDFFIRSSRSDYLVTTSSVIIPTSVLALEQEDEAVLATEIGPEPMTNGLSTDTMEVDDSTNVIDDEMTGDLTGDEIIVFGATSTATSGNSNTLLIIILAIVVIIIVGIISWLTTKSSKDSNSRLTNYDQLKREVTKETLSQDNGQSTELPLDKANTHSDSSGIPPPPPPARP